MKLPYNEFIDILDNLANYVLIKEYEEKYGRYELMEMMEESYRFYSFTERECKCQCTQSR